LGVLLLAVGGCSGKDTAETDPGDTDPPALTQLWINEFVAQNDGSYVVGEDTPDWIEIFNPNASAVDLLDWRMTDSPDELDRHVFAQSLSVPAGGFVVLIADGAPELGPEHVAFKLAVGGEDIILTDPWGREIDWVAFGQQAPDVATARVVDGDPESGWTQAAGGTPGASNAQ
jgi:hypothetical protein